MYEQQTAQVGVTKDITIQTLPGHWNSWLLTVEDGVLKGRTCFVPDGKNIDTISALHAANLSSTEVENAYYYARPRLTFLGNAWRIHDDGVDPLYSPILFYPTDTEEKETVDVIIYSVRYSAYIEMFANGIPNTDIKKNRAADVLSALLGVCIVS